MVVPFHRGSWCPYCNLELRALQQRLPGLRTLGAALVAVTPEHPDRTLSAIERNGIGFPVLTDAGNALARSYGLIHRIAPDVVACQHRNGNDVAAFIGQDVAEVPVPVTYVVDGAGLVTFARIDADYTRRAEPAAVVVAAVRAARKSGRRPSTPGWTSTV